MSAHAAEIAVLIAGLYAGFGTAVALVFLIWGIGKLDPAAEGVYAFRPLLAPGIALLWPFVLWRWARDV